MTAVGGEGECTAAEGRCPDLMSDEEDGVSGTKSGWIVRAPSFCSQELSDLCTTLQDRL